LVLGTAVLFALLQSVFIQFHYKNEADAVPLFAPYVLYFCGMPVAFQVCSV
jgi:hypothetical protein